MDRFASLQLFIRVVDRGSFTRAAHEWGIGQPAVSKQVAALEARLGTPLLNRTSRGLHPTAAGQDFYDSAVRLLGDLEEAENRVARGSSNPAGLVRVAVPPALGGMYIVPQLPAFFARFPNVTVELSVGERRVDLIKEGFDLAFRVGTLGDSSLIARRIGSLRISTVATPDYLARHGTPSDPAALWSHNLVTPLLHGGTAEWLFLGPGGQFSLEPSGNIRSNDAGDQRAAVLAGVGIGRGPTALFAADLRAGTVVSILNDFAPPPSPIHVVYAGGRRVPGRLRVVAELLAEICASEPSLCLD
ncbi:LysR substrate-binding domain-containing protein [Pseudoroseomonas globiformis]|uniref:LysR substrate-binding domain-containing protein n=1 Tax=Teichococcus globiformis TaxID=2307229 RepID=A0ABV7G1W5_9PROT